jgi:hypothetical protein
LQNTNQTNEDNLSNLQPETSTIFRIKKTKQNKKIIAKAKLMSLKQTIIAKI